MSRFQSSKCAWLVLAFSSAASAQEPAAAEAPSSVPPSTTAQPSTTAPTSAAQPSTAPSTSAASSTSAELEVDAAQGFDAQAAPEDLSLVELLNVKVTSASRTPQVVAEAPGTMTVFTREQIQRMGVSTLEELLNYVPGFQVTSDAVFGRLSRITVRGLFSTVSSGILLLRDGVPVWNAYDGSAWHFGRHFMLHDVERVEVIRGPGSTMWGTNASSGVVNVITVKDRNTVAVGAGNIGRRELAANFYHEARPELKLSGSVQGYTDTGFTFHDYTDGFGVRGDIKDPFSQYTATVRGEYEGLTLTVHSGGTWWREFVNWAAASRQNRNTIDRHSADLAYALDLGRDADLAFGLTYSNDSMDTFGLPVPNGIELIPGQPLAVDWIGGPAATARSVRLRTDATWRPIKDNTLNVGLSAAHGWIARAYHFANYDPQTLQPFPTARRLGGDLNFIDRKGRQTLIGLYLQDTHRLGPVALTAGVRADYMRTSAQLPGPFERETLSYLPVLPRAAVSYTTPIDSTLKAMYGRAFRAPSISELTIAHNPVITGGLATQDTMRPEIVDTGELAYTQNLFSRLSMTATGYVSHIKDLITPGQALTPADACFPVCPPGSTALGNNSKLLTSGLEFELKANPVNGLLLVGGYSRLLGAWRDDDRVDTEQSVNAFSADIGYTLFDVTLDVSGYYRQKLELLPQQDDYFVVSSRLRYGFFDRLSISATAENLLDEQYIGLTSYNLPEGAPARGRTFYATLSYE